MGLSRKTVVTGVAVHNDLTSRSVADCHPTAAITGLDTSITSITNTANTANTNATNANTTAASANTTAGTANTNANTAVTNVGTLASLLTTAKTSLVAAVNELFNSVSNGKSALVSAITGKGGTANTSQTFAQLAADITAIPNVNTATGDATTGDVLAPRTFSNGTANGLTGTLALTGTTADGNVLAGKTYYNTDAKTLHTGTMPDKSIAGLVITPGTADQIIPNGYFNGTTGSGKVGGDANLLAGNIRQGASIFGVAGNVLPKTMTPSSTPFRTPDTNTLSINSIYTTNNATPTKVISWTINCSGTYRISIAPYQNLSGQSASARIYKNGVAYGTLRTNANPATTAYTEDLVFNAGDTCEIWIWSSTTASTQALLIQSGTWIAFSEGVVQTLPAS